MARKDDILASFMEHKILKEKYNLKDKDIPANFRAGMNSSVPIIRTISMIIDGLENTQPVTDKVLRETITQYLNTSAI